MNSQIETHDQSSTDPPIHRSTDPPIHRSTDPQSINQYKTIAAAVRSRICSLEAIAQKNSDEGNERYIHFQCCLNLYLDIMRSLILNLRICAAVLVFSGAAAQSPTFEYVADNYNEQICTHVISLEDDYLAFVSHWNVYNPESSSALKIDKDGNFISEIELQGYQNYFVVFAEKWNDTQLILDIVYPIQNDTATHERCILITDFDLKIESESCHLLFDYHDGFANRIINDTYRFVFSVGRFDRGDICYGSFNKEGNLEVNYSKNFRLPFPSSIELLPNENYLIFTATGVVETDSFFNFIKWHTHLNMSIHGSVEKIDTNLVVVAGIDRIFDTLQQGNPVYYKNVIHYLNPDISVIGTDRFDIRNDPDSFTGFNYPALKGIIDVQNDFIVVASNISIYDLHYASLPNNFQVLKYKADRSMERIWQMTFGGDENYIIWGVIATEDGGCLVYGFKSLNELNVRQYPYLLKLDENGLISSTNGADLKDIVALTIYGNPSSTLKMALHAPDDWRGHIEIYDLQGRLVHKSAVQAGVWDYPETQNLANGLYMITVSNDNRMFETFKWVKQ
jgi:hypothetical protein